MKQKHLIPGTFFAVLFLYNFASGFAHPVTPTLIVERALPSQWYGYAMSAVSIGTFAIAPFWGKLCNYVPTKRLTMLGLMGYILGQIIMCTAHSGPQLLIGRMVAGLLSCAATIGNLNYIINVGDERMRGKYLTIYATAGSVCNAAGYFVGGMLGMLSLEAAFIGQGIVLATATVLAFFFLEDDTPYKLRPERGIVLKEVNPFSAFLDAKQFMTPLLMCFFASFICIGIGMSGFENSFNYYIKDVFKLGSEYNGTIKAVIAISGLVVNGTLGMWIINRTDVNKSFAWAAAANALFTTASMLFFRHMVPLSAMFVLYSISNIIFIPMTQNLVAGRATPENSNSLMGFYQAMRSFGSVIGSFVQANLYAVSCFYSFYFSSAIMLVGMVIAFIYVFFYQKQADVRRG